jgi:hypothetical protein
MRMNAIMEQLEIQLKTYPFRDDKLMASFFKRNMANIHALLPGEGSSCREKREKEFNDYYSQSLNLLQNENLYQRRHPELLQSIPGF